MSQLLKEYKHYLMYVKSLASNTSKAYLSDMELFNDYLNQHDLDLLTATSKDIENFLIEIHDNYQKMSINRMVSSLNSFYNYLEQSHNHTNPLNGVDFKHHKAPLPKTIFIDDIKKLIDSFESDERDQFHLLIVYLLLGSGLRVSELTALTFSNYYSNEGMLNLVGKGNKIRWVPIHDKAKILLNHYLEASKADRNQFSKNFLLINKKGKPITRQYVYTMLRKQGEKAGIQETISPHRLRHGFASILLEAGSDLRIVQELLGHASIATTQVYTHLQPGKLHENYDAFHPGSQIAKELKDDEEEI